MDKNTKIRFQELRWAYQSLAQEVIPELYQKHNYGKDHSLWTNFWLENVVAISEVRNVVLYPYTVLAE